MNMAAALEKALKAVGTREGKKKLKNNFQLLEFHNNHFIVKKVIM